MFARDVLRVLVSFNDDDFGMPLGYPERCRMKVQSAEVTSEILVLFGRQILIAKEEDKVLKQRGAQSFKLPRGQRARKIDAVDLGA